ncbi:hypothetical protein R6Z07F_006695 [Ovis aries]
MSESWERAQEAVLPEWIQAVESTVTLQELATGRNVLDIHAGDCCSAPPPPYPRWLQQGTGGGEVTKRDEKKLETRVGTALLMTDKVSDVPTGYRYWTTKRHGEVCLRHEPSCVREASITEHDVVLGKAIKQANYIGSAPSTDRPRLSYVEHHEECRLAFLGTQRAPRSARFPLLRLRTTPLGTAPSLLRLRAISSLGSVAGVRPGAASNTSRFPREAQVTALGVGEQQRQPGPPLPQGSQ